MRVGFLSDVHGNLPGLEAVLKEMERQGPFDELVVSGDLVWGGPWPAEVVDRVRALGATVLQGNTDAFFGLSPGDPPESSHRLDFAGSLRWTRERLGEERVAYLMALPFAHRIVPAPGHELLAVHANPGDFERKILPGSSDDDVERVLGLAADCPWRALTFGHHHVPFSRTWHGRLLVDVASAGMPMDGDQRAVFTILAWDGAGWTAEHRRVPYEVPVTVHEMRRCGLPIGTHFAERLLRARY